MFEFINRIPVLVRVPLRFGLIGGVLGFALMLILYYIGRHPFLIHPAFDFRVALFGIFIFFLLKEVRDYHLKGTLYFWQGIAACGVFVLTFSIIASLSIWIFSSIAPEFVSEYIKLFSTQVRNYPKEIIDQIGKERYELSLEQLKSVTGRDLAMLYFGQGLIIGFFISIILSVILRRQPVETSNN